MTRQYMERAAEAREQINKTVKWFTDAGAAIEDQAELAKQLGYIYNHGIRTAPRGVQSTVRLNAVREALKDQNVMVTMVEKSYERRDGSTGTYNALHIRTAADIEAERGEG